ncbi:MAG: nickel-dependent lactate racemase [Nitrososphaeria archaeon]|nr:nickel-dependent lactate racemase [Nitrososphaeria archaeon]NIN52610.1 nickel-dependent lactate racemase [Nitrososphaeria archaeon]NIQ33085.1 nickel-dependent lactate racemase [Nitrososphaeria archaeon]
MSHVSIELPYGKSFLEVKIPTRNFAGELECHDIPGVRDELGEIQRAVENPIEKKRLCEIASSGDTVSIVVTDITRRSPDHKILPSILKELKSVGVHDEKITIVTALGIHRPMTEEEIKLKIGSEAFKHIRTVNHNCHDKRQLMYLGETGNLKTPVWVNKTVAEADIKVTTGIVEIHTIAGYSGGGKSIMPGVSGEEAIMATHKPEWIDNPKAALGLIEGNPIHEDIVELARMAGVDFIVNTVLNSRDELVCAAAGDVEEAQLNLIETYDRMYKVPLDEPADIVVSAAGYPKDLNLYQASRAANNFVLVPKPTVKEGGIIIIPAPCQDGVGDQLFYEWMRDAEKPQDVLERAYREYKIGVHKPYIMSKILAHADVILAGSQIPDETVKEMLMIPARNVEEALEWALKKLGSDSRVLVAPHGFFTLPTLT